MKKLEDIIWNGVEDVEKTSMNGEQTAEPIVKQVNGMVICCIGTPVSSYGTSCK